MGAYGCHRHALWRQRLSRAQINGLQTQFRGYGHKVIAVTDAGFKPEKQVADLETIMAQKPNIIVSIPTDPTSTASAYKAAADAAQSLCSWITCLPASRLARIILRRLRRQLR